TALLASVALAIACAPGAPPATTPSPVPAATAPAAPPAATATPARAAAAAASPSPAARTPPPPSTAVSLTLPSQGMDFIYAAAARARGYFAEEGLDVGT